MKLKIEKKGAIELSVSSIVFLILAIAVLSLGLFFIKGMFGKTSIKFEELISREPEPPQASASYPITLSRETITANPGATEAVKIDIFNPTNIDWTFRDYVEDDIGLCGVDDDNICYINSAGGNSACDNDLHATSSDNDCTELADKYTVSSLTAEECKDEGGILTEPPEGICFIDNINCQTDPDCAPTEGVRLQIECSHGLSLLTQTNPKTILSNNFVTFTALIEIDKGTSEGTYLCNVKVVGEGAEGITKDIQVKIGR